MAAAEVRRLQEVVATASFRKCAPIFKAIPCVLKYDIERMPIEGAHDFFLWQVLDSRGRTLGVVALKRAWRSHRQEFRLMKSFCKLLLFLDNILATLLIEIPFSDQVPRCLVSYGIYFSQPFLSSSECFVNTSQIS